MRYIKKTTIIAHGKRKQCLCSGCTDNMHKNQAGSWGVGAERKHHKRYSLQTFCHLLAVRFSCKTFPARGAQTLPKIQGDHLKIVGVRSLMRSKFNIADLYQQALIFRWKYFLMLFNLQAPCVLYIRTGISLLSRERFLYI